MHYWTVPQVWEHETVAILGGGPSLNRYEVEICKTKKYKIIAINNSYLLDPTADIIYFCDIRWWKWHCDNHKFTNHPGLKVTLENIDLATVYINYKYLKNLGRLVFNFDFNVPGIGHGLNAGYQALNLAYLLGAKLIILLGIDMAEERNKTHWHTGHPIKTMPTVYQEFYIPAFNYAAPLLKAHGISVLNANRRSALKCFDYVDL